MQSFLSSLLQNLYAQTNHQGTAPAAGYSRFSSSPSFLHTLSDVPPPLRHPTFFDPLSIPLPCPFSASPSATNSSPVIAEGMEQVSVQFLHRSDCILISPDIFDPPGETPLRVSLNDLCEFHNLGYFHFGISGRSAAGSLRRAEPAATCSAIGLLGVQGSRGGGSQPSHREGEGEIACEWVID